MKIPSNALLCRALFLQAADDGRGPVLFGTDAERTCGAVLPFVEGVPFPELYLEFPLAGDPFLDATVLFGNIEPGTRFASAAAAGTERVIDWFARTRKKYPGISFGFELDAGQSAPGTAAVHFQYRQETHLAAEFCEAAGETEAGRLYTDLAVRMPEAWPLSFFGMFRGRPGSPLRVCGYLSEEEKRRCAGDPSCLEEVFREIGFTAYDGKMLGQVSSYLGVLPNAADFQFDILPDGTFGETFAIDAGIAVRQREKTAASFDRGVCAELMKQLESWGAADGRWRLAADMSLTRSLQVENAQGENKNLALVLTPNWIKARWRGGILQKAKAYCLGRACIV